MLLMERGVHQPRQAGGKKGFGTLVLLPWGFPSSAGEEQAICCKMLYQSQKTFCWKLGGQEHRATVFWRAAALHTPPRGPPAEGSKCHR